MSVKMLEQDFISETLFKLSFRKSDYIYLLIYYEETKKAKNKLFSLDHLLNAIVIDFSLSPPIDFLYILKFMWMQIILLIWKLKN